MIPALNHSLPTNSDGTLFQAFPSGLKFSPVESEDVKPLSGSEESSKRKREVEGDEEDEDREEKEAMRDLERSKTIPDYGNQKVGGGLVDPCSRLWSF